MDTRACTGRYESRLPGSLHEACCRQLLEAESTRSRSSDRGSCSHSRLTPANQITTNQSIKYRRRLFFFISRAKDELHSSSPSSLISIPLLFPFSVSCELRHTAVSNLCCPLLSHFGYTHFVASPIFVATVCKHDVIYKPEVHNVAHRRRRRTEPRPFITCI